MNKLEENLSALDRSTYIHYYYKIKINQSWYIISNQLVFVDTNVICDMLFDALERQAGELL